MPDLPTSSALRRFTLSPEGLLLRRLGLLLAVYAAIRLVFLIDHRANFDAVPLATVLGAFLQGMRFDLSAIAYSNVPFILLSLAPAALQGRRWYQWLLMALFVLVNGTLVIIMVGDVGYYPFTGTRVTMDVFALSNEAAQQVDQLLLNFAGLTATALLLVAALAVLYPRARSEMPQRSWGRQVLVALPLLLLTVVAARGGLQKKPLKPIHAFASGNHEVGVLTLNAAFTLLHSQREQGLEPVQFFSDQRELDALLQTPYGYAERVGADAPTRPQNVVLLILESYGTEFWGGQDREMPGLTPFLDSLSRHGLFFTNSFANGRRSMDALPSILLGIPLLAGQSLAVSGYQSNEWRGLGHFLGEVGYHSSMYHGAPKGTMFFDAIAAMAGIEEFYPLERFPEAFQESAFDGHWGLYDEPVLQHTLRQLGTQREPWFSTIFTISTHHPYRVPPEYQSVLPQGSREIHQSVAYVDLAVRKFFEAAREEPWFEQTLFVITGDHTPPLRSQRYDTALGRYMVPVLLYHPGQALPAVDSARVIQHVDLFATILDYAGARPSRVPAFGRSLFADVPGEAVLSNDGIYWIVREEGVVERLPDGRERSLAYRREATGTEPAALAPALARELSQRLLAYVQHFTMSMINNSFYRDPEARTVRRADD